MKTFTNILSTSVVASLLTLGGLCAQTGGESEKHHDGVELRQHDGSLEVTGGTATELAFLIIGRETGAEGILDVEPELIICLGNFKQDGTYKLRLPEGSTGNEGGSEGNEGTDGGRDRETEEKPYSLQVVAIDLEKLTMRKTKAEELDMDSGTVDPVDESGAKEGARDGESEDAEGREETEGGRESDKSDNGAGSEERKSDGSEESKKGAEEFGGAK